MSVWRTHRAWSHERRPAATEPVELRDGAYLTDGRRLFRVVARLHAEPRAVAVLEDCFTLELGRYTPLELWRMNLHPVVPASDLASTSAQRRSDAGAPQPEPAVGSR